MVKDMQRGLVIALGILGVLTVVLAIALASLGPQVDELRIEREDLQFELEDALHERDLIAEESNELNGQLTEQTSLVQQLHAELERAHQATAEAISQVEDANKLSQVENNHLPAEEKNLEPDVAEGLSDVESESP